MRRNWSADAKGERSDRHLNFPMPYIQLAVFIGTSDFRRFMNKFMYT